MINDRFRVSKMSLKFRNPTIYNSAVNYRRNLQFSQKTAYLLTVSFLFINKTLRLDNLKTGTAMNAKISVFVICVEAIIHLLLYDWHDCTFKSYGNSSGKS